MVLDSDGEQPAARSASRRVSQRARKAVDRLGAGNATDKRGKRAQGEDEDDELGSEDDDDDGEPSEDESDVSDAASATSVAPPKKRMRTKASSGQARKSTGAANAKTPRNPRARAAVDYDEEDESGAEEGQGAAARGTAKGDFKISDDNDLFNSVRNPNTALSSTADEWVASYHESPGQAMAEFVNFLFRCGGCNHSIDEHQAIDENGIVETLGDVEEEFKKQSASNYPLISKSKTYKKFRSSLNSFLSHFYSAAASSKILYNADFANVIQSWISSMSSSHVRSFRHTATAIALQTMTAFNTEYMAVDKEVAQAERAASAERGKANSKAAKLQALEARVKTAQDKLDTITEYLDALYKSVFVNRYRDANPQIRAECMQALSNWMRQHPDYWIQGDYLRYIGWTLSDEGKDVRLQAVKGLFALYAKDTHIGSLQHFTKRFRGQLTSMAKGELDVNIRVQTINVLKRIEQHGLLEDEQRDSIAQLVFESERRVRHVAADFLGSLLGDEVAQRTKDLEAQSGKRTQSRAAALDLQDQLELKVLAEYLVKYGQAAEGIDASDDEDIETQNAGDNAVEVKTHRSRIEFAVEALWEHVEAVKDWQRIIDFLLLDHSKENSVETTPKAKHRGKKSAGSQDSESAVHEGCNLSEEEETLLVEVLAAVLALLHSAPRGTTKKEKDRDEEGRADVSRAVIEALPRLFVKHQAVPSRLIDVLSLPQFIKLDLYLDMNMISAYEDLWGDLTQHYLKQTDIDLLDQAAQTIKALSECDALAETNSTKMADLEESLCTNLRSVLAGEDVESMTLEDDTLSTLTYAVMRIDRLMKFKNMQAALDNDDSGKQTSAIDIVELIVDRGRLGYKDEGPLIIHCLSILNLHWMRRAQIFAVETAASGEADVAALAALVEHRSKLSDKFEEFSIGQNSNAVQNVKECAIDYLLNLYCLCRSLTSAEKDPNGQLADLRIEASEELQARCAGFVEAQLDRRIEELAAIEQEDAQIQDEDEEEEDEAQSDVSMDDDELPSQREQKKKARKPNKAKASKSKKKVGKKAQDDLPKRRDPKQIQAERMKERERLLSARRFELSISPFIRAMHFGVIDLRHSTVLLSRYGRLGPGFDTWCKLIVQDLQDEGMYAAQGGALVAEVVSSTLEAVCETHLDSEEDSDEVLIAVARALVPATVVRGAQLAIARRLPSEDLARLHKQSLTYIVKRLAILGEDRSKSQMRNRAISFFKALAHLLIGVEPRAALHIQKHVDATFASENVEVSATSKTWEPVRAYRKRLVGVMSKDAGLVAQAKQSAARAKPAVKAKVDKGKGKAKADDGSDEDEQTGARSDIDSDEEHDRPTRGARDEEPDEVLPARPNQGSPSRKRQQRDEFEVDEDEAVSARRVSPGIVDVESPAKRRKHSPTRPRAQEAAAQDGDEEEDEDEAVESLLLSSPVKRRRQAIEAEREASAANSEQPIDDDESEGDNEGGRASREASPAMSDASQISLSDVKRQMKRARR